MSRYVHRTSGLEVVKLETYPALGVVLLRGIDNRAHEVCIVALDRFVLDFVVVDELMEIALAFGVVAESQADDEPVPFRVAGTQPAVEFSTGPAGCGPLWSDEYLAAIVSRWAQSEESR